MITVRDIRNNDLSVTPPLLKLIFIPLSIVDKGTTIGLDDNGDSSLSTSGFLNTLKIIKLFVGQRVYVCLNSLSC